MKTDRKYERNPRNIHTQQLQQ